VSKTWWKKAIHGLRTMASTTLRLFSEPQRMRRVLVATLAGVVPLASLAALAEPAAATASSSAGSGSAYVALGDSFSAGQGVSTAQGVAVDASATDSTKASGADCYQSSGAYPALVASRFHLASSFTFAACGGATTEALFAPQVFKHLGETSDGIQNAQVSYLGSNTQLVTLSIGGDNNFTSFAPQLTACIASAFSGQSCVASLPPPGSTTTTGKFTTHLKYAYQQILAKAPNAQVYVLNYPNLFPSQIAAGSACDQFLSAINPALFVGTPTNTAGVEAALNIDFQLFQALTSQLNRIIAQAVSAVGGTRLHLVNLQNAFAGHEACTADPAANGIGSAIYQASKTNSKAAQLFSVAEVTLPQSLVTQFVTEGAAFHPNVLGNALMADKVNNAIATYGIGLVGVSGTPQFYQLPGSTSQPLGVTQDASGNIWLSDAAANDVVELPAGSSASGFVSYPLGITGATPTGIAVDQSGNVWVTDESAGEVTELVKASGYAPKSFMLSSGATPDQLSVDPYGNVWVAEGANGNIAEISPSGAIQQWNVGQDPEGLVTDELGNVWVVDEGAGVLEIVPSQLSAPSTSVPASSGVYLVQGTSAGAEQIALAPSGDLWFTEWGSGPPVLGEIIPSNVNPSADQMVVAQNYPSAGGAPNGVGVDSSGNVWVEDAESQSIYEFSPGSVSIASSAVSGAWTTYPIGTQISTYAEGDEGNDLTVSPNGNVYFCGYSNATPVTGYLGVLQGVAATGTSSTSEINGTTTSQITVGSAGDQLTIPAGDVVTTTAGTPFVGSIPAPVQTLSFIPPSIYGGAVVPSAFTVTPVLSGGLISHLIFSKPISLTYSFPLPSDVTPAEAEASTLWYYDPVDDQWLEAGVKAGDPGGSVTVADGVATITILVTHLTSFELFAGTPTTPEILTATPNPAVLGTDIVVSGNALGVSPGTASLSAVGSDAAASVLTVSSWSPSKVLVEIPMGLSPGEYTLALETSSGTVTNSLSVTIDSPTAVPILTTVSPTSGTTSGGTMVTITGTNLSGATAVDFGTRAATTFADVSATQITAVTPPAPAGVVAVTVTTPSGTSSTGVTDEFTYQAPFSPPPVTNTAPTVVTGAASGVTSTGATLNGTVNPNGAATSYQFDYGTSNAYGSVAPATLVSAGSGSAAVSETVDLTGLKPNTIYDYRIFATNSGGTAVGLNETFTTSSLPEGTYVPVAPIRVTDTRIGSGLANAGKPLGAGGTLNVTVAGAAASDGVPADAIAIVANVTAVSPTAASFFTVYPSGVAQPTVSNLNFAAGETTANLVTVPVGANGDITIFNQTGTANAVVDVYGYYTSTPSTTGAGLYDAVSPYRAAGTLKAGASITANTSLPVSVTGGSTGVPASATAVVVNLTEADATATSFLTAYGAGASRPTVSNLNFNPGDVRANRATVPVGTNGQIEVYNHSGNVHVDVDIDGYYTAAGGTGSVFVPIAPERVTDTRVPTNGTPIAANSTETFSLTSSSVPASATAVVANFTVVSGDASGYATIYPVSDTVPPVASDLNWPSNEAVANFAVADTAGSGKVDVYASQGATVNLVIDLFGYFTASG